MMKVMDHFTLGTPLGEFEYLDDEESPDPPNGEAPSPAQTGPNSSPQEEVE